MSHPPRVPPQARAHFYSRGSACVAFALASICGLCDVRAEEARPPAGERQSSNLDLARSVAIAGREAFNAGEYETALALFRRAYTLFPAPTVVLYEARTLERLGLLLDAVQAYARTTQMRIEHGAPAQFAEAIAAAAQEGGELQVRIPSLTVTTEGANGDDPNLTVSINGRALSAGQLFEPQKLNPGKYVVSAAVGTERVDRADVVLPAGQHLTVVLKLHDTSLTSPPPSANGNATDTTMSSTTASAPLLAYAAGGVGILGIGAGVVTGLMANGKHSEAERECLNNPCAPGTPGFAAADAFRTLRMASTVSYGVGAVGVAAGLVLWLTAGDDAELGEVGSLEPWGSFDTAGIRGTF